MEKEEILAMSRAEKKDEGAEYVMDKGRRYGIAAMTMIYLALLVFNMIYHQNSYTLFAMYWIYLGFEFLGRYKVTKKSVLLCGSIASVVLGIVFVAVHIISVARWVMNKELILKNRLKEIRTEYNLSQMQLARLVGVSRNTISSIETGQFNPTAKLALIICIALDKKFEDLFYFDWLKGTVRIWLF